MTFHKKLVMSIFLPSLAVLAIGCNSEQEGSANNPDENNSGNQPDPVSLSFAYELPTDHPWGIGAEEFKVIVEEQTNGEVEIEIHGGGALGGSGGEIQEGVEVGTIDIGISSTPLAQINPYVEIFSLPYIFTDRENAWEVLDGEIGENVGEHLLDNNLMHLAYWEDGFRQVTNNSHQITSPEDFEGLSIRVPESTVRIQTFEALGANPLPMSFSEVFTALQQGAIDGQENPLSVVESSSFYDVQDYLTITNHVYSPASLFINNDKWEGLTEEQQTIILEAAEAGRDINRELNAEQDNALISEFEEKGMDVFEIEDIVPFQEATKSVWETVTEELGEEGQQIIDDILATQ
ncbi:DctP family TRAP transporter solute-binding subunit [Salipaludibacillus sp. CUR1]|uniref:DctP family TRAP transporter solute-binding subunit n=1 Tax=Salipaludibacillus sp. CUR1 TaxID=2820003 RepID=UPI001E36DC01|nr:DctP family TRAP transporter solute-binding subunit [Salipaludibacillus sp. CUR1]MCE7792909.1 DctP family TRAP transporter solute-binding subunit [Salipaludibacillus sp. CUR1]